MSSSKKIDLYRNVAAGVCYLLVTWRVVSRTPCRRVADTSVWGSSGQPPRAVLPPLVYSTGLPLGLSKNCSGSILDITDSIACYHTGLQSWYCTGYQTRFTILSRYHTRCHKITVLVIYTGCIIISHVPKSCLSVMVTACIVTQISLWVFSWKTPQSQLLLLSLVVCSSCLWSAQSL